MLFCMEVISRPLGYVFLPPPPPLPLSLSLSEVFGAFEWFPVVFGGSGGFWWFPVFSNTGLFIVLANGDTNTIEVDGSHRFTNCMRRYVVFAKCR